MRGTEKELQFLAKRKWIWKNNVGKLSSVLKSETNFDFMDSLRYLAQYTLALVSTSTS